MGWEHDWDWVDQISHVCDYQEIQAWRMDEDQPVNCWGCGKDVLGSCWCEDCKE